MQLSWGIPQYAGEENKLKSIFRWRGKCSPMDIHLKAYNSNNSSASMGITCYEHKAAFLQGQNMEREIYVMLPKEANSSEIWLLCKSVYSLSESSLYW